VRSLENAPYLSASAVVFHYEEALYQVYAPLPLPFSSLSAIEIKASVYSNSRGKPAHSSLEIISITITNSRELNTNPCWHATFTINALLYPSVVLTTVCAPSYIAMTAFGNHSSTPVFLRAHLVTFLDSRYSFKCFFQIYKSKV